MTTKMSGSAATVTTSGTITSAAFTNPSAHSCYPGHNMMGRIGDGSTTGVAPDLAGPDSVTPPARSASRCDPPAYSGRGSRAARKLAWVVVGLTPPSGVHRIRTMWIAAALAAAPPAPRAARTAAILTLPSSRRLGFLAPILAFLALWTSPAQACKGASVLLDDTFQQTSGWDQRGGYVDIGQGIAVLRPIPGTVLPVLYGRRFEDIDICAETVISPDRLDPAVGPVGAGIAFWAKDYGNYYWFTVWTSGMAQIQRYQDGRWTFGVLQLPAPTINTSPGAINVLRLVLKGRWGTAYINDRALLTFPGVPPADGSKIGIVAVGAQRHDTRALFKHVTITSTR